MLARAARGAARRRAAPEVGGQRWIVRNARSLRGRAQSALGSDRSQMHGQQTSAYRS